MRLNLLGITPFIFPLLLRGFLSPFSVNSSNWKRTFTVLFADIFIDPHIIFLLTLHSEVE